MELLIDQEIRKVIPSLTAEEYKALEASLIQYGNLDPIVIWKEKKYLLDGHNRYDICHKHKLELKPPLELPFKHKESALIWVIDNQLARRNLQSYQRVVLALTKEELIKSKARVNLKTSTGGINPRPLPNSAKAAIDTREELAKKARVGHDTIWKVKQVEENAPEFIKTRGRTGEYSVNEAYRSFQFFKTLREEDKEKATNLVLTGQAKNIITARKFIQRENAKDIKPPEGKYQLIYTDPPWEYEFGFDIHGAANRHYNTIPIKELCEFLQINNIADDNSVLFLWATSPKLRDAFAIIDAWGFEYKTSFVWDKVKHVMGHYNSLRHEFLLIAVKGSYPKQSNKLLDSVVTIERSENHSAKPEEFRAIIDEMYPSAKKIELFRDQPVEGCTEWEFWGKKT